MDCAFGLRKDTVSDLITILVRDPFRRECKRVTGDLFGVSVFAACTVIHKVSRAIAKQKGLFLSFLENPADTKRKF